VSILKKFKDYRGRFIMNKKIVLIALTGLLGGTLLSTGLVKNDVFVSTISNKTEMEVSL
jgi:hypothetical protein